MLVRQRKSRIYFLRRFFDYPIRLTAATFRNLGIIRTFRCGASYLRSALLPQREERTLEDFIINRFGNQLYRTFFKSYTEKVRTPRLPRSVRSSHCILAVPTNMPSTSS
jgi:protoporphyrinogen oxidase